MYAYIYVFSNLTDVLLIDYSIFSDEYVDHFEEKSIDCGMIAMNFSFKICIFYQTFKSILKNEQYE